MSGGISSSISLRHSSCPGPTLPLRIRDEDVQQDVGVHQHGGQGQEPRVRAMISSVVSRVSAFRGW